LEYYKTFGTSIVFDYKSFCLVDEVVMVDQEERTTVGLRVMKYVPKVPYIAEMEEFR
jgi:hypothetical protein